MAVAYLTQKSLYWYTHIWLPYLESLDHFPTNDMDRLILTWFVAIIPTHPIPNCMLEQCELDWPFLQLLERLRPTPQINDFISILKKCKHILQERAPDDIMFANGVSSDRLVVWRIPGRVEDEKIWIRWHREMWLFEDGLKFLLNHKFSKGIILLRPNTQSTPNCLWFSVEFSTWLPFLQKWYRPTIEDILAKGIKALGEVGDVVKLEDE